MVRSEPPRTAAAWAKRREQILANMQLVMGPLPGDDRKVLYDDNFEVSGVKDCIAAAPF